MIGAQNNPQLPPAPPTAPRTLTPKALRRSMMEPKVRFWWMAAGVLFVAAIYFLGSGVSNWREELKIVEHGTPVTATIVHVGEGEVNGVGNMPPDTTCTLQFDFNNTDYTVQGTLEGRTEPISPKEKVQIKVDPDDPNQWTYSTQSPSIGKWLVSFGLLAPFTLAMAAVSWMLRRRVLMTWRDGTANPFEVQATSQTALAPSSKAVRCRPLTGRDQRVVSVFIPRRLADPKTGDILWLIHPPGKPAAAVAALAYQEDQKSP